ncbi:alpha/beta-hydrolase [Imleria badia]|nr:alpha/beta-hydrolase [Imleria badia]
MLQTSASFLVFLTILGRVMAGPVQARTAPTVTLDSATVTGITSGSTNQCLGIPFAEPPYLPQTSPPYNTSFHATAYGPTCPQRAVALPLPSGLPAEAIDQLGLQPCHPFCRGLCVSDLVAFTKFACLTLNVWIFGGGFEIGGTSIYDGSIIVEKAISFGVPAVYVSMNYRQEVKDAGVGNIGLRDQRLALQWVLQKYISTFGGDPTKWGKSAGAISVALHMVTSRGNPDGLFRAAFMESGSPIPVGDIGQPYYDALIAETGCFGASDTLPLQCLREVPYETLVTAVNQSPGIFAYQSLVLAWLPRVDGQGFVADIPFINGDCDDEGTLFSFSTLNVMTNAQFEDYLHTYLMPNASTMMLAQLTTYYPSDPGQGSPFDTGDLNALTPQHKRIAAIREMPQSGKQSVWTYVMSKRFKIVHFLGSFHASDLLNVYGGSDMASYLVRFVTNLDPNVGESTDLYWPQYDATNNQTILEFSDGLVPQSLTADMYRAEAMAYLTIVTSANPL